MFAYHLAFGPDPEHLAETPGGGEPVTMLEPHKAGYTGDAGPSIPAESWPRGPRTGRPMWHAFTVEVPEDYRAQGPDFVGLSFFASDGQFADEDDDITAVLAGEPVPDELAEDPFFKDLATYRPHPQLQVLEDSIGGNFAVLWLTREELEGPRTQAPAQPEGIDEDRLDPGDEGVSAWTAEPSEDTAVWLSRYEDPNVGLVPTEYEKGEDGYTPAFDLPDAGEGVRHAIHFGGTSFHVQGLPELTPTYLEIEEFSELNFGGGNAQYDLETGVFDWAC